MKQLLECVHTESRKVKVLEQIFMRDLKYTSKPTSMLVTRVDAGLLEETS